MKITLTTKYAMRAAVCLALAGGILSSKDIAQQTGVPHNYLMRILNKGIKEGIFAAHQGVLGGYSLKIPAGQISMLDLVRLGQGPLEICDAGTNSQDTAHPLQAHPVMAMACGQLQSMVETYLKSISLSDLAAGISSYDQGKGLLAIPSFRWM